MEFLEEDKINYTKRIKYMDMTFDLYLTLKVNDFDQNSINTFCKPPKFMVNKG